MSQGNAHLDSMPLVPLLPLFHSLNRAHFDGALTRGSKPIVAIRWSDGRLRKTAGFYRRRKYLGEKARAEIVLSKPLLEHLPQVATESTLCHEMIHAWVDLVLCVEEGHGFNFHKRMALINASQKRFQVSVLHKFPVSTKPPKWLAICPSCGIRVLYQRRVPGAACRQCCNLHHGGTWDSTFVLTYVPASEEV